MDANAANNLKVKYIKVFDDFRKSLYKGHKKDYRYLIDLVVVIENSDYFDNNIYEYLMSNE